jgi:ankyrin repeat protein
METAMFGSVGELKTLLDGGLDPNLLAYVAPDASKTELLLARGATPDERALAAAASYRGSAPALRLLLDAGGKVSPGLLRAAATAGDAGAVELLIANGADPNHRSERGETALAAAAMANHPDTVRLLARHGAAVDVRLEDGMTPLIVAAILHRTPMVRLLLELGADPQAVDRFGYTALRHTGDIAHADPETAAALKLRTPTGLPPKP